ncbi:cell division protein PerM [Georgenia ruanii]|uniref:Uncharacterized protein n=1 Tax=Georgenia ruanii TaxID=348442 RepID=A0A7J9US16_9MICO|nr:DUF6350 family protein [Georgenia ruanii]MPV87406.1 hypothetical protein [Georgenia ruanii]
MPTTGPTAPHVIDASATRARVSMPAGWLRGLVAGVEAAMLSWLTVVVPAVATYVATAAAPALGEASWQAAAGLGTSVWLLGHGGSMHAAGAAVSLVPLGVTLLSLALVYGATRRMRLATVGAGGFVPAGFALATLVLGAFAALPGSRLAALGGAVLVAAAGTALALWRAGAPAPAALTRWRVPAAVTAGLAGGGWALGGLLALATAGAVAAAVVGWDRVLLVQHSFAPDVVSAVVMTLAQLIYVPTAVVWALAWLAGPGFAVGQGTVFSATDVTAAPLPAVPLLGALPSPGTPALPWVVLLPGLVGLAVGIWLHRRRPQESLAGAAGAALTVAGAVALGALVLGAAASGGIGPGRMAEVGPAPAAVAGLLLVEVGAGALVGVLLPHPRTRAGLRAAVARGRAGRQRTATGGPAATPGTTSAATPATARGSAAAPATAEREPAASPAAAHAPTDAGGRSAEPRTQAPRFPRLGEHDADASPTRPAPGGWGGPRLSEWPPSQDA